MTAVSPDIEAVARTFAMVPLFARLSPRQRERLAQDATARSYAEGTTVVKQGDTSMALYVILAGRVAVRRERDGAQPVEVNQLGPGGVFGELGLLDDEPRAATIVALEPTICALLAKWDFQNALRDDPDIALALLPVITARLRGMLEQVGAGSLEAGG